MAFTYGTFTLSGLPSQVIRLALRFIRPCTVRPVYIPLPPHSNARTLTLYGFRLFPFRSPLLGESLRFLFLLLLRCFSSQGSLPFQDTRYLYPVGFPIRASALLWSLAPPRGFSQLATPFFASRYLGILREPFIPLPFFFNSLLFFLPYALFNDQLTLYPLVETRGFEPLAFCLQSRRSPS